MVPVILQGEAMMCTKFCKFAWFCFWFDIFLVLGELKAKRTYFSHFL